MANLKKLKEKKDSVNVQVKVPRNIYSQVRFFLKKHGVTMTGLINADLQDFIDDCKNLEREIKSEE